MKPVLPQPGTGVCGAYQPTPPRGHRPYRCSEPLDHTSAHRAVIDGEVVAQWPRRKR